MSSLNENIEYRILTINECDRISEIDPSQWIEKAWRDVNGRLELVTINYMENDWPDGYETYRDELKSIINSGGVAFGAFNESGSLVGFATINHDFFGETARYLLLDSMFVSRPYRGTGLGKELFKHCANQAYEWGADKLYLCAGSSEDTIAFYKALGCVNAEEINKVLYDEDHRDIQLEYDLAAFQKENIYQLKVNKYINILRAWDINMVVDFEEYVTSAIRFTTANGKNYVLKRKDNIEKINTEHELLKHIQNNGIVVPVPLKTTEGNLYVEKDGVNYTLYDYIEGNTIQYDFEKDNRDVLFKHGQVLGKLHRVMNTYNGTNKGIVDMNIENEVLNWAIPLINRNISDSRSKEIMDDIAKEMKDIFAKLSKQYIHRDPHGRNIIFQGDSFIGFIDFDLCKIGYKVFDLCYVMTGVLMDGFEKEGNKEKWLDLITQISSGYETENSIEPEEKKSFWYTFLAIQMICTAWFYHINDSKMAKLNIEALYWIYDNKESIESKIK